MRSVRTGSTCLSSMAFISQGTPGRANSRAPSISMTKPGAVPSGSIAREPRGRSACFRFASGMALPNRWNTCSIVVAKRSSRSRETPATVAMASRVMSSGVGPKPPVTMTTSLRSHARWITDTILSRLSPTTECQKTFTPISARAPEMCCALVLGICPSSSSVPTPTISAFRSPPPCSSMPGNTRPPTRAWPRAPPPAAPSERTPPRSEATTTRP